MNLLHISPRLRPGGINQLAADLACGLQQSGFRNTILAPPNELIGRMTAASVHHHSMRKLSLFTWFSEIKRARRVIGSSRADIVLAYTTQAAQLAWVACKELPEETRPRIIGIHTTYPRHRGWALTMECCDALVATSQHLREELIRRAKLDAERSIWVIPYGVNEELCHPGYRPSDTWMEQWKRHSQKHEGKLSICLPGPITPLHGLQDLPAILARLARINVPVHVYIAGDTARADQRFLNQLHKHFQESGTMDNITWLGLRTDLRDVMSACQVVLSLARQPACHDRIVLEALSLGKPVVGYDHGIVGEMLDTYMPSGRVAPGDIAGIADCLEQWHAYLPPSEEALLYPYRLADTIRGVAELCTAVCQSRSSSRC